MDAKKKISVTPLRVVKITRGGPLPDGTGIVLELRAENGKSAFIRMAATVASQLIRVTQRVLFDAQKLRTDRRMPTAAAKDGAYMIKSPMISFETVPDGSAARMVITGASGPPVAVEFDLGGVERFRDQAAKIVNSMKAAQVRH